MYFAIHKIKFQIDERTGRESKDIAALCVRLAKRFKACVQPSFPNLEQGEVIIVSALLSPHENGAKKKADEISDYCEGSGFGRVYDESLLLDHIDTIDYE